MVYAVIGDVVGSRQASDQRHMLEDLAADLDWVNSQVEAVQALAPTVGDEFQGCTPRWGQRSTRLCCYGCGGSSPNRTCRRDSGSASAKARSSRPRWRSRPTARAAPHGGRRAEAIDRIEGNAARNRWPRSAQTAFAGSDRGLEAAVNAFLLTRDALLARADRSDARICLGLFLGESQREVAEDLGVTQPAVAQRSADKGWHAVWQAHALFEG